MAARGALVGHAVFVEQVAQQFHLADAGVELFELGILVEAHGQGVHVAARHAAVGEVTLVHDAVLHRLAVELLVVHGQEAAHVHHAVLLGRNGHQVGVGVDFAYDLLDALVLVAGLAGLDEVGVLGEAGRVDQHRDAVAAAQLGGLADVAHRNGLAAGRVVGDGQHHARDLLLRVRLEHVLQLLQIHFTLERKLLLRVGRSVDGAVDRMAAAELDVALRGVEMRVARHDVALLEQGREDHVLGGAALVGRQEVGHAEEVVHDLLQPEVGRGAGVALVARHHGRPLAVAHRARARVGQQVDGDLVAAQFEEVVFRFADPLLAFGTGRGTDRLGHLDLVGLAIG